MHAIYFLAIIFLCFLLERTTGLTVRSLRAVRERVRVNELIMSFFFLGVVTSVPEMFVAIMSAIRGIPELSLGNLLGANIVVLSFMVGLTALLAGGMSINNTLRTKDFFLSLGVTGLPLIFVLDGALARWEGVVICSAFLYLLIHFYRNRHFYRDTNEEDAVPRILSLKDIGLFAFSIVALLVVSYLLVEIVLLATAAWQVPVVIIGLFLISIGTNVPEMAFVITQASQKYKENKDIATGILLGNVVVNAPVIGMLAIVRPFTIEHMSAIWITAGFLALTLIVLGYSMVSHGRLSRHEGILLLCIYAAYLWYSYTAV